MQAHKHYCMEIDVGGKSEKREGVMNRDKPDTSKEKRWL